MSFKAHCRTEKKTDTLGNPDADPVVHNDFQITDQFLYRCGIEALKKLNSLVVPRKPADMPFNDIEAVIRQYIEPRQRLVIAEQSKFVSLMQNSGETASDFLARLREAARYCEFANLRTIPDPESYMIRLRFIAGLGVSEHKFKMLEHLQTTPESTVDDLLTLIQCREQTIKFVNPALSHPESIAFVSKGKKTGVSRQQPPPYSSSQGKHWTCKNCGGSHPPRACPAFGKTCNKCGKPNHYAKMCRASAHINNFAQRQSTRDLPEDNESHPDECVSDSSDFSYYVENAFKQGKIETVAVQGKNVSMLRDTGASVTCISEPMWKQLGSPPLSPKDLSIETYDQHKMEVIGEWASTVTFLGKNHDLCISVVKCSRRFGLLGRDILDQHSASAFHLAENSALLPVAKGVNVSVKLLPGATGKVCAARRVPLPLEQKVNEAIDDLVAKGILVPVQPGAGGVSNASLVVWAKRSGGRLRMCADYKVHVNGKIHTEAYPIPCIETIFSKVEGSQYFAKIDLHHAYWQIALDESSQEICMVNTTKGLFKVTRLQQGLKNASAIFQHAMEQVLKGLAGIIVYQDDILALRCTSSTSVGQRQGVYIRGTQ